VWTKYLRIQTPSVLWEIVMKLFHQCELYLGQLISFISVHYYLRYAVTTVYQMMFVYFQL